MDDRHAKAFGKEIDGTAHVARYGLRAIVHLVLERSDSVGP
jgi:hypothetical protein